MVEDILRDLAVSDSRWRIAMLRYFNPVGAHESGLIGEDPNGIPNNLLPYIAQVAAGKLPELAVFGNDYPTPDGTGVRDYIHVWNLGTGQGYSVLDLVRAFEVVSGTPVSYRIGLRRPGDIATCYADPIKAGCELGWKAKRGLLEMIHGHLALAADEP